MALVAATYDQATIAVPFFIRAGAELFPKFKTKETFTITWCILASSSQTTWKSKGVQNE